MLYKKTVIKLPVKPRNPPLQSTRLLDQVRERARYLHYSLSTEKVYLYWVRFFIRWHGLRHPRDMGPRKVEAFLTMLATERKVSASTHNQAHPQRVKDVDFDRHMIIVREAKGNKDRAVMLPRSLAPALHDPESLYI